MPTTCCKPREDGNDHLHRFLTIADGVVRSQGRKIIFSTNLPNVRDLDDALVRPGRCFAHVLTRALNGVETEQLLAALTGAAPPHVVSESATLAEIYRAASHGR